MIDLELFVLFILLVIMAMPILILAIACWWCDDDIKYDDLL